MSIQLVPNGKPAVFGLTYDNDANGNPTHQLPGPVTWAVSDATKATATPSADGLTVSVQCIAEGDFQLTATSGSLTASVDLTGAAGVTTGIHIVQEPDPTAPAAPATAG